MITPCVCVCVCVCVCACVHTDISVVCVWQWGRWRCSPRISHALLHQELHSLIDSSTHQTLPSTFLLQALRVDQPHYTHTHTQTQIKKYKSICSRPKHYSWHTYGIFLSLLKTSKGFVKIPATLRPSPQWPSKTPSKESPLGMNRTPFTSIKPQETQIHRSIHKSQIELL